MSDSTRIEHVPTAPHNPRKDFHRNASARTTQSHTSFGGTPPGKIRIEVLHFGGEFLGTFMFLFMAFAGCHIASGTISIDPGLTQNNYQAPEAAKLLYISFSFGMALAVNIWVWAHVSGAMFNPAVTFALVISRTLPVLRAAHCVVAQLLAAICASAVIKGLLPGTLAVSTHLEPRIGIAQGLFLEVFATFQLVIVILMVAIEKNAEPMLAPLAIGLALFISELGSVYYTGGSLNPARSFGPAVLEGFDGYHWIYWVGPLFGAGLAAGVYSVLKWLGFSIVKEDFTADEWQGRV